MPVRDRSTSTATGFIHAWPASPRTDGGREGCKWLLSQPRMAVREPSGTLSLHQALRLTQGFGTPISVRGSFSLTKGAHQLPWREVGSANKQSRERMRSFLLAGHLQSARCALLPASGDKNGFCGKQDHTVCHETAGSSQQRSDCGVSR